MKQFSTLVLLGLLFVPTLMSPAIAQEGLALPPEGQTLINFSATETRKVPQDLLLTSLRIEVEDSSPVVVQKKINELMKKALDVAKAEPVLKVSTGGYNVYKYDEPIDPKAAANGVKPKGVWRGSQTIDLESKESVKILDITGKIQEMGFAMNNMAYTLSPEVTEKVRDELLVLALKKLQDKATIVGKTLGKSKYELTDVNVDMGGPVMPMYKESMMMRGAMAMDAGMPPPVAAAGETDVSLTVSARALIRP